MSRIYDFRQGYSLQNRTFFFDTNVWISIDGGDPRPKFAAYSNFYGEILRSESKIVINDYVVGDFFNRSCKTIYKLSFDDDPEFKKFKRRRVEDADFRLQIETVRDTCLNMLDDCLYERAPLEPSLYCSLVDEAAQGIMDLTDLVIREHCRQHGYVLVTHDRDYFNCDLEIVTTNQKLLDAR